eukprot:TRINITY_DN351_c0_g1_i1.p1 TRINITY_DN351_c0_g1~~TRINITY_DN351_c0_g1_i1.p1  ORF type:complete len:391 (+),score=95.56 TRINITY_DN351_c0_g1_i1:249-1421(+)
MSSITVTSTEHQYESKWNQFIPPTISTIPHTNLLSKSKEILSQPCFTDLPEESRDSYSPRTIHIPHPYSEDSYLECIHYPPHKKPSQESADKTPILFVHGAFHGAWCFGLLQQYFQAKGVETFAVSLRNHGKSFRSHLPASTHLGHLAEDVEVAVRYLFGITDQNGKKSVNPYVLVGHSVGGAIVQRFVSMHSEPEKWRGEDSLLPSALVILFGFAPVPQLTWMSNWWSRHPVALLSSFVFVRPKYVFEGRELVRDGFFTSETPEEIVAAVQDKMEANESLAFMMDLTFHSVFLGGEPQAKRLGNHPDSPLKGKIVVMGAGEDKIVTSDIWDFTSRTYGTEPEVLQGVGHDGFLDTNWKQVAVRLESSIEKAMNAPRSVGSTMSSLPVSR